MAVRRKSDSKTTKPKASGTLTSSRRVPITKRTYDLETKRKGSTKGYSISNGRYYKEQPTKWKIERKKAGGKTSSKRVR